MAQAEEAPVAEEIPAPVVEELALDAAVEVADEAPANVMPLARPEPVAPAPAPEPEPVEIASPRSIKPAAAEEPEERPLTLFEKMMNLSRGPKAKPAAEPVAPAKAYDTDPNQDPLEIPRFFKRQVND